MLVGHATYRVDQSSFHYVNTKLNNAEHCKISQLACTRHDSLACCNLLHCLHELDWAAAGENFKPHNFPIMSSDLADPAS